MAGNATELEPMAFINGAARFAWAADELRKLLQPGDDDRHADPVYLFMAHAIELALKGYLRLHGCSTLTLARPPYRHNLQNLHKECERRALTFHGDRTSICTVLQTLDESNRGQGLRYFILESQRFPEVRWAGQVVRDIVDAVRQAALTADPDAEKTRTRREARHHVQQAARATLTTVRSVITFLGDRTDRRLLDRARKPRLPSGV